MEKGLIQRDMEEFFGVIELFLMLIVVVVTGLYAFINTCKSIY